METWVLLLVIAAPGYPAIITPPNRAFNTYQACENYMVERLLAGKTATRDGKGHLKLFLRGNGTTPDMTNECIAIRG